MRSLGHIQKALYRLVYTVMSTYGRGEGFARNQVVQRQPERHANLPGRGDSPQTYSKSCSDKLAAVSCTSLLNSFLSSLISPSSCYIDYLVVPRPAYHPEGFCRAFQERLRPLQSLIFPPGYRLHKFETLTTDLVIHPTLTAPTAAAAKTSPTCPTAIIHVQGRPPEAILGGVKMGSKFPPNARGASCLCRARMAEDFVQLLYARRSTLLSRFSSEVTYAGLKRSIGRRSEQFKNSVKQGLGGWVSGHVDSDFTVADPHQHLHHRSIDVSPLCERPPEEATSPPEEPRAA